MMPNEGDSVVLLDARDGKKYSIGNVAGNYWMTKNLDIAGGTTITSNDSNVSSNYKLTASSTSGFNDDAKAFVYNSKGTDCSTSPGCYSYYSYIAATAGTNPSSGDASYDICPKGWRLPTKENFETLISSYSTGAKLVTSPWYGVYAGRYNNSSFLNGGADYGYWSSTAGGSAYTVYAYALGFYSSAASTNRYGKGIGYPVRCVKK